MESAANILGKDDGIVSSVWVRVSAWFSEWHAVNEGDDNSVEEGMDWRGWTVTAAGILTLHPALDVCTSM
jgi:hypothetical protein